LGRRVLLLTLLTAALVTSTAAPVSAGSPSGEGFEMLNSTDSDSGNWGFYVPIAPNSSSLFDKSFAQQVSNETDVVVRRATGEDLHIPYYSYDLDLEDGTLPSNWEPRGYMFTTTNGTVTDAYLELHNTVRGYPSLFKVEGFTGTETFQPDVRSGYDLENGKWRRIDRWDSFKNLSLARKQNYVLKGGKVSATFHRWFPWYTVQAPEYLVYQDAMKSAVPKGASTTDSGITPSGPPYPIIDDAYVEILSVHPSAERGADSENYLVDDDNLYVSVASNWRKLHNYRVSGDDGCLDNHSFTVETTSTDVDAAYVADNGSSTNLPATGTLGYLPRLQDVNGLAATDQVLFGVSRNGLVEETGKVRVDANISVTVKDTVDDYSKQKCGCYKYNQSAGKCEIPKFCCKYDNTYSKNYDESLHDTDTVTVLPHSDNNLHVYLKEIRKGDRRLLAVKLDGGTHYGNSQVNFDNSDTSIGLPGPWVMYPYRSLDTVKNHYVYGTVTDASMGHLPGADYLYMYRLGAAPVTPVLPSELVDKRNVSNVSGPPVPPGLSVDTDNATWPTEQVLDVTPYVYKNVSVQPQTEPSFNDIFGDSVNSTWLAPVTFQKSSLKISIQEKGVDTRLTDGSGNGLANRTIHLEGTVETSVQTDTNGSANATVDNTGTSSVDVEATFRGDDPFNDRTRYFLSSRDSDLAQVYVERDLVMYFSDVLPWLAAAGFWIVMAAFLVLWKRDK